MSSCPIGRGLSLSVVIPLLAAGLACNDRLDYQKAVVDPRDRVSVSSPQHRQRSIRFGLATMLSPRHTAGAWTTLIALLGAELERPIEIVHGLTYTRVNDMMVADKVDLGFLCTGGYLALRDRDRGVQVLVVPEVGGKLTYHSIIVVSPESPFKSWEALRGKRFAFVDPLSQTGYAYPTSLVKAAGSTNEKFFASLSFTGSHDRAIAAVARRSIDGAAVDELIYQHMKAHALLPKQLRIVKRSPPFGIPPIVVGSHVPRKEIERWRAAMLRLHQKPAAKRALVAAGIDRFVLPPDGLYQMAEALRRQLTR